MTSSESSVKNWTTDQVKDSLKSFGLLQKLHDVFEGEWFLFCCAGLWVKLIIQGRGASNIHEHRDLNDHYFMYLKSSRTPYFSGQKL